MQGVGHLWRTRNPVESPQTLIHAPGVRPEPEPQRRRRGILRGGPRASPSAPDELVLERYRLLERLGAGGFGEVWRARDELLQRDVALKRIRLGPEGDSDRAAREAQAAARLSHPAIVALYEACAVEEAFYLISELVDGETLAELIACDELQDEEILEIGLALTGALAHAHARGVIHRDIKPQNVLVPHRVPEAAGAAKLTDFGGASLAGEDGLTRTGDVLGTLAYMAPEQSEGREVGVEADLYALALVLYEAFSGVNPVRGATPAATARRIGGPLEHLERPRRDLPRELTRAIDRALAPSPRDRGSLADLGHALERALDGHDDEAPPRPPILPRARTRVAPPPPRPRSPYTREPWTDHAPEYEPGRVPAAGVHAANTPAPHATAVPTPVVVPGDAAAELPARRGHLALPRLVWLGCALAGIVWQVLAGRPGVALLAAGALAPLLALPRRSGPAWMLAALAPALGLVGLAGAFPAIAGQPRRWRERAALGALGYWWLTLAEPLLAERLWLGVPANAPSRAAWEGSLNTTAAHVVGPALSLGVLFGALLWGAAAMVLPWIVRGRSAAADVVAATVWSAALAAAAPVAAAGLTGHAAHPSPHGAVLGAVLGGVIAVASRALRGPVRPSGA
jgi:hypothetical protein